jgi:hypothetical protein
MKKLYFLNEEEKNRILRIHENATKQQYLLSEQNISYGFTPGKGEIGYTNFEKNVSLSIKNYCSNDKTTDVDPATLDILKFSTEGCTVFGMGYKTYDDLKLVLQNMTKNKFCATYKKYIRDIGSDPVSKIMGCIREVVPRTDILKVLNSKFGGDSNGLNFESNTTTEKKESGNTEKNKWDDFKCVKDDKRTKKTTAPNILKIVYNSGDYYFWDDGKYKSYKKGEKTNPIKEGNYKCDDNNQILILRSDVKKDSSKKTEDGTKEYGTGNWYSLNQTYDNQIKQALGKDPGKLTDEDINLIYDKLKQSGKIK